MQIITKKVNEEPVVVELETLELSDMQSMVGGLIERLHVGGKVDMWLNERGKLENLPINILLSDNNGKLLDSIHGDIFFAGFTDDGDTVGLTNGEVTWIMNKLEHDGLAFDTVNGNFVPIWFYDPTVS